MDFDRFLNRLNLCDHGVVAFNTYLQGGKNRFFIMVADRGEHGTFIKKEGDAEDINDAIYDIIIELERR